MNTTDLKAGDILLCPPVPFSKEEPLTCLGHIIIKITGGKVSHAAIYSGEINNVPTVSHADLPGIATVRLSDFLQSEHTCYVFRHKYTKDAEAVADIAVRYTIDENPYPVLNLGVLGVLLLMNKFSEGTLKSKLFYDFIVWLSLKIMKEVNKAKYEGKSPMTCSQFAAQCYTDGGEEYDVRFEKMLVQFGQTGLDYNKGNSSTLLSHILVHRENRNERFETILSDENEVMHNEDQIITRFAQLLDEDENGLSAEHNAVAPMGAVCSAGEALLKALQIDHSYVTDASAASNSFDKEKSTNRNYFVAPDDLYFNTTNFEYIGTLFSENA